MSCSNSTSRRGTSTVRTAHTLLALALVSCGGNTPTAGDPPADVVTSVQITPATATLVSLGDTLTLVATPLNGSGGTVATTVVWSMSDAGIASLAADGTVVATANGQTTVTATADGVSASMTLAVAQEVASLAAVSGDTQGGDIGSPLDSTITVLALDARGNPAVERLIAFSATLGGGQPDTDQVTTDALGQATVGWTLGTLVGPQELTASAGSTELRITAFGFPLQAAEIRLVSGGVQEELYGHPLPEPLVVQVVDSLGNGVPDVSVHFSVVGTGTLAADSVYTDLDGMASVEFTVGHVFGRDTVFASIPDSTIADIVDFPGSPVRFLGRALGLFLDATPPEARTGDTISVIGHGFPADPTSTDLTIDGLPVDIISGGQREITFVVPDFGCSPEALRRLTATRDSFDIIRDLPVAPRSQLQLAVGERTTLVDGSCVQLPGGDDSEYLVGITATRPLDAAATYAMTAFDSVGPLPASQTGPARVAAGRPVTGTSRYTGEFALRAWENSTLSSRIVGVASALATPASTAEALLGGPAAAPPVPGEVMPVRVPDILGDPCTDYTEGSAQVIWVGPRLAISSTIPVSTPLALPLTAALTALSSTFGANGVDVIASFLGLPADWDADTRIHVVLDPTVEGMGVASFSTVVDQLPRATCPASDEGRLVYVAVPPAAGTAELIAVLEAIAPALGHEIAHIVQSGRRLAAGGALLPAWLAEGQAQTAVEAAGLSLLGLAPQGEHGAAELALSTADQWLGSRLDGLAYFNGWDGGAGAASGAPEGCSLFGFAGPHVPCDPRYSSGAAWSFVRYLSDRIGAGLGGESAFHQALLDTGAGVDPLAAWEVLAGSTVSELMLDWAATLYVDGRLSMIQSPDLQLATWDLQEALASGPRRLTPATFPFGDFSRTGAVLGGGTAYSLIGDAGSHPPLAVRIDNGAGGAIAPELQPRIWVVRMR